MLNNTWKFSTQLQPENEPVSSFSGHKHASIPTDMLHNDVVYPVLCGDERMSECRRAAACVCDNGVRRREGTKTIICWTARHTSDAFPTKVSLILLCIRCKESVFQIERDTELEVADVIGGLKRRCGYN